MDKIQGYVREEIEMVKNLVKDLKYKIRVDSMADDIILKLFYKNPKNHINQASAKGLRIITNEDINFFTKYILPYVKEQIKIFKLEDKKED